MKHLKLLLHLADISIVRLDMAKTTDAALQLVGMNSADEFDEMIDKLIPMIKVCETTPSQHKRTGFGIRDIPGTFMYLSSVDVE